MEQLHYLEAERRERKMIDKILIKSDTDLLIELKIYALLENDELVKILEKLIKHLKEK